MAYTSADAVRAVLTRRGEELRWETEDIENAIALAERIVNAYCGRHFYDSPAVEIHVPVDGVVALDMWPVVEIISVKRAGTDEDVEYQIGELRWGHLRVYTSEPVRVVYTYNDPQSPVPAEVSAATAEVAANILSLAYEAYGDVRLGDLSIAGPEGDRYLTPSLRAILAPYRRHAVIK